MTFQRTGISLNPLSRFLIIIGRQFFNAILSLIYLSLILTSFFIKIFIQLSKPVGSFITFSLILLKNASNFFFCYFLKISSFNFKSSAKSKVTSHITDETKSLPKIKKIIPPIISITTIVISTILLVFLNIIKQLPEADELKNRNQIFSTKIYDRNGELLYKIYKKENRTPIQLNEVPDYLIKATIAIEDKNFYKHSGYSLKGILRAFYLLITEKDIQGGSTITQQLVKNALLTNERSMQRKLKEIILSVLVEIKYSKDEILTMYLNEVGYGGSAYGIEEAAQMYFSKPAAKLNLSEATLLAGLPAAPTHYSPFGANPELAKYRQHEVLRRMQEEKFLSSESVEIIKNQKLIFASKTNSIKAPHFVMYVKDLLVNIYGEHQVEQGGLEVFTTLDLNLQNYAQQTIQEEIDKLQKLNITNAAALVTKPNNGEILAMVGSKDFFDFNNDGQVNVTLRPRQPGSAIKPINYLVALENGYNPATLISDTPITYNITGQPPYSPKNYDNSFHGNVSLRQALANSYNVPAVKTLSSIGIEAMLNKGKQMGITTWDDKSKYGLSLTLGGGEVKMTDLATVYGALANYGYKVNLNPILKITDYQGKILYQNTHDNYSKITNNITQAYAENYQTQKVTTPEIAFLLSDILSDNEARSAAFGTQSLLNIPHHQVAVKTGTTQNMRDNWTIGYTTDFLVSTWVGNNDNSPMSYVASGITGATPIWNKITHELLSNSPNHLFSKPKGIIEKQICPLTGTLACNGCYSETEYFVKGIEPTSTCKFITDIENNKTRSYQKETEKLFQIIEKQPNTKQNNTPEVNKKQPIKKIFRDLLND